MDRKLAAAACAMAFVSASGSAHEMSHSAIQPERCFVTGSEKLPAEAGGFKAICDAIDAAVHLRAPGTNYRVEVTVLSSSSLAATITLDGGQSLPEQKMAVSDRQLNRGSIDRFASAVAAEISKSANR